MTNQENSTVLTKATDALVLLVIPYAIIAVFYAGIYLSSFSFQFFAILFYVFIYAFYLVQAQYTLFAMLLAGKGSILAAGLNAFFLVVSIAIAYFFASRKAQTGSAWKKTIMEYLFAVVLASVAAFFIVMAYNSTVGNSCSVNKDCEFGHGVNYIQESFFGTYSSFNGIMVCESSRCEFIHSSGVNAYRQSKNFTE